MTIHQILQKTIQSEGPISFERFMELSLYHPSIGYYNYWNNPIGSNGDFYTVPHITPVFGAMIARQLKEMWEKLGQPIQFTIVEIRAGNGHLCRSILKYAKSEGDFSKAVQYIIVEQSKSMCNRAKEIVPQSVLFYNALETLPNFIGCVLSNELFDNIPFCIAVKTDELMEVYVDHNVNFHEILKPASLRVKEVVEEIAPDLPANFRMEVSPKSAECLKNNCSKTPDWIRTYH